MVDPHPAQRVLVCIPTYDEADSLPAVLNGIRAHAPEVDILVADDNSPDGTGEIADELAEHDERLHVLHRTRKAGLGAAYLAAFAWGFERGYDVLVEMDADGSHRPEDLPALLGAVEAGADLVLGTRWMPGGSTQNWPRRRQWLSKGGNWYARTMLGVPLRDITGGFRAYRASTLRALDLDTVRSEGYCFQIELALRASEAGEVIREVPITFVERRLGASKMSRAIVVEAMVRVTEWGLARRARLARRPDRRPGDASSERGRAAAKVGGPGDAR
jgi:dolichol-phosphate mannosyltransferase